MKFALLVTAAPYSSQAPQSALAFCEAALAAGHEIGQVFLYGDGVHLASVLGTPPADEPDWYQRWRDWLSHTESTGTVCVASALRRGLLDQTEAQRWDKPAASIGSPWQIGGLGEWVQAQLEADRVLVFEASA